MTKEFVYSFVKKHWTGVLATTAPDNTPEAALMGIAVTGDLELIFDTVNTSRKYVNLKQNNRVALVIGWDDLTSIQYEGIAEELSGPGAEKWKEFYFEKFPDGREKAKKWPGMTYFKVTPKWIRYSSIKNGLVVEELAL